MVLFKRRQFSVFQHLLPFSAASSPHLGTQPGDTHFLRFCDIRGMNHKPQILLEATLKQISDAYDDACVLKPLCREQRRSGRRLKH